MNSLGKMLAGSDRRSIGTADALAGDMLANPGMVDEALQLLVESDDRILRARAADAIEKATRENPSIIQPYKRALLRLASQAQQQEVRWHLAQMIPRLRLRADERRRAMSMLRGYVVDGSRIVQVCAMQALWDLSVKGRTKTWVLSLVEQMRMKGSPAVKARARRLLKSRTKKDAG